MGTTHTRRAQDVATIAGGAAGDHTVTGITVYDRLLAVVDVSAAGANLVGEFSITAADTINNDGGTDTTGAVLLIIWDVADTRGGDLNEN